METNSTLEIVSLSKKYLIAEIKAYDKEDIGQIHESGHLEFNYYI
jgi:hypothetical protein